MNLVSFNGSHVFDESQYRTGIVGTSDRNTFIPVYSITAHNLLVFKDGTKVIEYSFPGVPTRTTPERTYFMMNRWLRTGHTPKKYNFTIRREPHEIYMHKGLLYKDGEVLMCMGINSEYVMNNTIEQIRENPDPTKYTLFISKRFEQEEIYKNIWKKMNQMYIDAAKGQDIDVVITSRANTWLFKNNYEQPKFKNVSQMMKHLKEVPKTLITE